MAMFLDGCFWHGCPDHFTASATDADYRQRRLARNKRRAPRVTYELEEAGWLVRRIWGHSVKKEHARKG